jgi:hypothetical protein
MIMLTWMYRSATMTGIATSTSCHVTKIMIAMVVAISIEPEITKVIANGMSKSKMLKSDEACRIQRENICLKITTMSEEMPLTD